jgi:hypothetical protein
MVALFIEMVTDAPDLAHLLLQDVSDDDDCIEPAPSRS